MVETTIKESITRAGQEFMKNTLYYGDNLDILREYVADESVDLIYLDPPFNSNRSYNVLFKESNGTSAESQITAFDDSWHWNASAEETLREIEMTAAPHVVEMMDAIVGFVGRNDMTAYLVMMTLRLIELHRVLKDTGSIYLHCDPTASHYLKIVMDTVFGKENFRTEIVWKRTSAHSDAKQGRRQHGRVHDIILFYSKEQFYTWNTVYSDYDDDYIESNYGKIEDTTGRYYKTTDLTAAKPGGETSYEWKGVLPYKGRYWAYSKENMQEFERKGLLYYTSSGMPRLKQYLDEMPGIPLQDLWTDITPAGGNERLGYPTQKPLSLLERIIEASSNPGDVVLDPFCGCGTAVAAAQKLGRKWLGIDITHLSIALMRQRLDDMFGDTCKYEVVGQPADLASAEHLARVDRHQFEWWALSLIKAQPANNQKKGADQGIDGVLYFRDTARGSAKKVVVQVKSGHVQAAYIRDLAHVVDREKAVMGFFITLERPSKPMDVEALGEGYYHSDAWGRDYQKVQIRTIEQLLGEEWFDYPQANVTLAQAERVKDEAQQDRLL